MQSFTVHSKSGDLETLWNLQIETVGLVARLSKAADSRDVPVLLGLQSETARLDAWLSRVS